MSEQTFARTSPVRECIGPLVAHTLVSADATALLPRFTAGMETETAQAG